MNLENAPTLTPAAALKLAQAGGDKVDTFGQFTFVELSEAMLDQCLTNYQFCSITCTEDFGLSCSADAKNLFSIYYKRTTFNSMC